MASPYFMMKTVAADWQTSKLAPSAWRDFSDIPSSSKLEKILRFTPQLSTKLENLSNHTLNQDLSRCSTPPDLLTNPAITVKTQLVSLLLGPELSLMMKFKSSVGLTTKLPPELTRTHGLLLLFHKTKELNSLPEHAHTNVSSFLATTVDAQALLKLK